MDATAFSPLALTQVLPFLPLAQGTIDYEVDRRGEDDLIGNVLGESSTQVMLLHNGLIAVPRGQGVIADREAGKIRPALVPGTYIRERLAEHQMLTAIYLGVERTAMSDTRYVAIDITRAVHEVPDAAGQGADDGFDHDHDSLLDHAVQRFDWVDLRGFAPHVGARDAGLATSAVAVAAWHNRQRFCPCCGAAVTPALAGWAQRCTNANDGNRILFPRVEPAVITAIVDSKDRLLLQHNAAWKGNLHSVSAGFVEAGENLEHAARREALEETGIKLGQVKYLGSQPWPFPSSLMMAFKAQALTTDIQVDHEETLGARWFTRSEFTDALASGQVTAPGKATIARYMIEEWYGSSL